MATQSTTTLCRITVAGRVRFDVAVPSDVPLAQLIPTLLWHTGEQAVEAGAAQGGWGLQRLGESMLDTSLTLAALRIRDGDIVYFRPRAAALPELVYDDPVDGIGDILRERSRRWDPAATRKCSLTALTLLPLAGLAPILAHGPSWALPAVVCGVLALVLVVAAGALSRTFGDSTAGVFCGFAAIPYAAAAGLLAPLGTAALTTAGAVSAAMAGAGALAAAIFALAFVGIGVPDTEPTRSDGSDGSDGSTRTYGTGGALLGAAIPSAALAVTGLMALSWNAVGCAAVVATVTLAFTVLIPRVAYRASGLPRAAVSLNAADLRALCFTMPTPELAARTLVADRLVTGAIAGAAVAVAAGVGFSLHGPGPTPVVLGATTAVLVALRARVFGGLTQRWWLIGSALALTAGSAYALATRWPSGPGMAAALVALFIGTAIVGQFARRPEKRPTPPWNRTADIAELLGVIAAFPLALLMLGAIGYFRSLAG